MFAGNPQVSQDANLFHVERSTDAGKLRLRLIDVFGGKLEVPVKPNIGGKRDRPGHGDGKLRPLLFGERGRERQKYEILPLGGRCASRNEN